MKDLKWFSNFLQERLEMLWEISDNKALIILPELKEIQNATAMVNLYLKK